MIQSVVFSRVDRGLLFLSDRDKRTFLERAQRLARRWHIAVLAFQLDPTRCELLVRGARAHLEHWQRLVQSGHGAYMRHHASMKVPWMPPLLLLLPRQEAALAHLRVLHQGSPWAPWSSLWEGLGLRRASFFDGSWVRMQGTPRQHMQALGWAVDPPELGLDPAPPSSLVLIDEAILAAVGVPAWRREQALLRTQVAIHAGWSVDRLCVARDMSRAGVRKALREPSRPELEPVLAHLRHPELRARLLTQVQSQGRMAGQCG